MSRPRFGREARPKQPKLKRNLEQEIERVRAQFAALAEQPRKVLAGPFTGEVGFELLYWIPLLRWALREYPDLRGRVVVISRGGVEPWLNELDVEYVDILTLFPPEDFAVHRAAGDKQRRGVAEFELRVIEAAKERLGLDEVELLHPSVLYQSYFRILKINQLAYPRSVLSGSDGEVDGLMSIYRPIAVPPRGRLAEYLPEEYVAVRFYSRDSFPDTPEARRFSTAVIESLSRTRNVVLVGHRFALDEHRDLHESLADHVTTIDHLLTPENNLALQTAVVGHASAFVGTYGGFAYLAPFLGVPSLSFSVDRAKTHPWHYELAAAIFAEPGWGDFLGVRTQDLALIDLVSRDFDFDGFGQGGASDGKS